MQQHWYMKELLFLPRTSQGTGGAPLAHKRSISYGTSSKIKEVSEKNNKLKERQKFEEKEQRKWSGQRRKKKSKK